VWQERRRKRERWKIGGEERKWRMGKCPPLFTSFERSSLEGSVSGVHHPHLPRTERTEKKGEGEELLQRDETPQERGGSN